MAVSTAELKVVLSATDNMSAELKKMHAALGDLDTTARKSTSTFTDLAGTVGKFTVAAAAVGVGALAVGLGSAVKSAADFEKGISAISAVSMDAGESAEDAAKRLESLRSTALQLGKDTAFSATEAAAGMEELVKAGVKVEDVIGGGARAALDLAAAGGVEVAEAAALMSNALNAFSLSGKDAAHVANVIAGAANASAIDVTDFKFSLAAAGSVAATMGVNFEDTATAIALLGQAGIKGADAGTSLKTMLLGLIPTTEKDIALFNELGLSQFNSAKATEFLARAGIQASTDTAQLSNQVFRLITGTKEGEKVTAKQSEAYVQAAKSAGILTNEFFNQEGKLKPLREVFGLLKTATQDLTAEQKVQALMTIFGTDAIRAAALAAKLGADDFDAMAGAIAGIDAQKVAEERLNNLSGSLEKLGGSLETAKVVIGTAFLPALKQIVDAATLLVNENMPAIEMAAAGMAAAFVAALPSIQSFFNWIVTTAIPAVGELIRVIGDVLRDPLTWLAEVGWPRVLETASAFIDWLNGPAVSALNELNKWLAEKLNAAATWLFETGFPSMTRTGETMSASMDQTLMPSLAALHKWLQDDLPPAMTWMTETGFPGMQKAAETLAAAIEPILVSAWASFMKSLTEGRGPIVEVGQIVTDLRVILEIFGRALDALSGPLQTFWDWLGKLFEAGANAAPKIDLMRIATDAWLNPLNAIIKPLSDLVGFLRWILENGANIAGILGRLQLPNFGGGGSAGGLQTVSMRGGSSGNSLIDQAAAQARISPSLLASLVQQESGGKQSARSPVGAIGLTQLMPGTAASLGVNPYDEAENLIGGAKYLAQMIERFNGDTKRALIAYNAGPSGGMPAESVAFAERVLSGTQRETAQAVGQAVSGYVFPIADYAKAVQLHHGSHPGGSDLFAPAGTPIQNIAAGVVKAAGFNRLGGNSVLVEGQDGRTYYYAHLQDLPVVRAGQQVSPGDMLGKVGTTGNAVGTPPHLHLGIGQGIQSGDGPEGGTGMNFNAVEFLNQIRNFPGATVAGGFEEIAEHLESMGSAIQKAGPITHALQQRFDEVTAVIGQSFPQATHAGTAELRAFGAGAQILVDQLHAGQIGIDDAALGMVRYAAATGLSIAPMQQMEAGLIGQDQALAQVLADATMVNPAYANIAAGFITGATSAHQTTLDFLQLAASTQGVTDAVVPFDAAMKTIATTMPAVNELIAAGAIGGDELSRVLIGLSNSSGLVKSTLDLTTASTAALDAELMRIIDEVSFADPKFRALNDTIQAQGGITDETRAEVVKLFNQYGLAQPAIAPAIAAHDALGASATTMATDSTNAWQDILRQIASSVASIDAAVKRLADAVVGYINNIDSARAEIHVDTSTAVKNMSKAIDKAEDLADALDDLPSKAMSWDRASFGIGGWNRDNGGMIPGRLGEPSLGIAHGGEMVLTPGQQAALLNGKVGGGGQIVVNVNAPVYGVNDMETVIVSAIDRAQRRGRMS